MSMISRVMRGFLALNALIFIGLGLRALSEPLPHMAPFGLELMTTAMTAEVRANYGGMHMAMGLLFVLGVWNQKLRWPALLCLTLFTSGLVLGRLLSLQLDGHPGAFVMQLLVVEAVGAVIGGALLWAGRNAE